MAKKKPEFSVHMTHGGRTCIKVGSDGGQVSYIPMDITGFSVQYAEEKEFNKTYKLKEDYPLDRACQLYLGYCKNLGCTEEVLDLLSQVITVTKEDRDMATNKRAAAEESSSKKKVVSKRSTQSKEKPAAKKPAAKKPAAKKPAPLPRRPKSKSGNYTSAAKMFQALIMEGKLTDDKIFQSVQKEFGLDDSKRSYVKWYRNHLAKSGKNPPEAK